MPPKIFAKSRVPIYVAVSLPVVNYIYPKGKSYNPNKEEYSTVASLLFSYSVVAKEAI